MQITNKTLKEIGNRLRRIREEKHLSQTQLAGAMDMLPNQYNKIEKGKSCPTLESLTRIAEALDTSLDVIVYGASRHKVKPQDASLSAKLELMEQLPSDEKFLAEEFLKLVLTRHTMKNVVSGFGNVPASMLKKQGK